MNCEPLKHNLTLPLQECCVHGQTAANQDLQWKPEMGHQPSVPVAQKSLEPLQFPHQGRTIDHEVAIVLQPSQVVPRAAVDEGERLELDQVRSVVENKVAIALHGSEAISAMAGRVGRPQGESVLPQIIQHEVAVELHGQQVPAVRALEGASRGNLVWRHHHARIPVDGVHITNQYRHKAEDQASKDAHGTPLLCNLTGIHMTPFVLGLGFILAT